MFESLGGIGELDRAGVLAAVAGNRQTLLEAEAGELLLAAQWADLHNQDTDPTGGPGAAGGPGSAAGDWGGGGSGVFAGTERTRQLGHHGTPPVWEFAAAEFGAVNQMSLGAAENLIADSLDLRHRHPGSWAGLRAGVVRAWQARKVAHLSGAAGLRREQAHWVDTQVVGYYTALPWARFLDLVAAKIIEVDPDAAQARATAAAMARFVRTGQCNEYGLKTMIVAAAAGDVIVFVAMCDRIGGCQMVCVRGGSNVEGVHYDHDQRQARCDRAAGTRAAAGVVLR